METKIETKDQHIIAELKKARDAQEPEKSRQFAVGFEALGDYFVEQSEAQKDNLLVCHRTALKAIALYQLAFSTVTNSRLLEKIQAVENAMIERSGHKPTHQSLASYEQEIEYWKKRLQQLRFDAQATLKQVNLGSPEIKTIYKTIATGLKSMAKDMTKSCFKILPPPDSCVYSIITLGSLAREEATPFSDFEWAILIEENNEEHKNYFRRLSELLWIKVINLGETTTRMMDIDELDWLPESENPCHKGFSFDGQMISGCHTPLGNRHHTVSKLSAIEQSSLLSAEEKAIQKKNIEEGEYELIGTPEELAQFQTQVWETKRGFCTVLSTVAPIITTNDQLVQDYEKNMAKIWNTPFGGDSNHTLIQHRSLTYLTESVERFKFKGGYFGKETHSFDAKYDLYRLPNMLVDHLASYFSIQSKNLWERIEHIFGEAGIAHIQEKSGALKQLISQVLGLRLQTYFKKGYRDDHIVMFDLQNPEKNEAVLKKYLGVDETLLLQIYSEFIELQARIASFIKQRGKAAALAMHYGDLSDLAKGEVYHLLLNYSKAALAYKKAKGTMVALGLDDLAIAETLNNLGLIYQALGRYDEAIAELKESEKIKRVEYGSSPLSLADTMNNLGNVYVSQGRYHEAIAAFEEAKEIRILAHNLNHPSVAETLNNLGIVYEAQARFPEAIAAYEEAKRINITTFGTENLFVAGTLNNLGNVYRAQARYPEALAALEEAKRIRIATHGASHLSVADTLNNLGIVYKSQGRYLDAIAMYDEVKRIRIATHGHDHLSVAETLNNLGNVYESQARYPETISAYAEAKRITIAKLSPTHPYVAEMLNNLGVVYQAQARYPEAIAAYEESNRIKIVTHGAEHLSVGMTLNNLGVVYALQARYSEAIATFGRAIEILKAALSTGHPFVADMQCSIGQALIEQRSYEEARALFQAASIIYEQAQDPKRENVKSYLEVSYIREGNAFMLQEGMDIHRARSCYQHASSTLDPQDPKMHQHLANHFSDTNQLTAALEHYRILIRLAPKNASAHHNLACMLHARACIEQSKGESKQAMDYIQEAEGYFERAIQRNCNTGICTEYAQFLWKNRAHYDSKKIIALLQQAIGLQKMEEGLSYGRMERPTLDQYLQCLLDQENKLTFKAIYLAHYLLIQVYCATDQLPAAQALCRDFQAHVKADEEAYPSEKATLLTQANTHIKASPDKTKLIEEQLQQQILANETRQRLHAKLVERSQAAIERCILSHLQQSSHPDHSPILSPRLLRDSPILGGEAAKVTNSRDEEVGASLNPNL